MKTKLMENLFSYCHNANHIVVHDVHSYTFVQQNTLRILHRIFYTQFRHVTNPINVQENVWLYKTCAQPRTSFFAIATPLYNFRIQIFIPFSVILYDMCIHCTRQHLISKTFIFYFAIWIKAGMFPNFDHLWHPYLLQTLLKDIFNFKYENIILKVGITQLI